MSTVLTLLACLSPVCSPAVAASGSLHRRGSVASHRAAGDLALVMQGHQAACSASPQHYHNSYNPCVVLLPGSGNRMPKVVSYPGVLSASLLDDKLPCHASVSLVVIVPRSTSMPRRLLVQCCPNCHRLRDSALHLVFLSSPSSLCSLEARLCLRRPISLTNLSTTSWTRSIVARELVRVTILPSTNKPSLIRTH